MQVERPEGIIVQFGGQTPLKISTALQQALDENPIPAGECFCVLIRDAICPVPDDRAATMAPMHDARTPLYRRACTCVCT